MAPGGRSLRSGSIQLQQGMHARHATHDAPADHNLSKQSDKGQVGQVIQAEAIALCARHADGHVGYAEADKALMAFDVQEGRLGQIQLFVHLGELLHQDVRHPDGLGASNGATHF
jgi:hypothetical protein